MKNKRIMGSLRLMMRRKFNKLRMIRLARRLIIRIKIYQEKKAKIIKITNKNYTNLLSQHFQLSNIKVS